MKENPKTAKRPLHPKWCVVYAIFGVIIISLPWSIAYGKDNPLINPNIKGSNALQWITYVIVVIWLFFCLVKFILHMKVWIPYAKIQNAKKRELRKAKKLEKQKIKLAKKMQKGK